MPELAKRRAIYADEVREIMNRQFKYLYGAANEGKPTKAHALDWLSKSGFCECGCQTDLSGKAFEFEHTIPIALQYEGDPINWKVWLKPCHVAKTKRDVKAIAKAKRCSGETGQQARRDRNGPSMKAPEGYKQPWPKGQKIQGRGFAKKGERKSYVKDLDAP